MAVRSRNVGFPTPVWEEYKDNWRWKGSSFWRWNNDPNQPSKHYSRFLTWFLTFESLPDDEDL